MDLVQAQVKYYSKELKSKSIDENLIQAIGCNETAVNTGVEKAILLLKWSAAVFAVVGVPTAHK